jgi:hypothetical protein
MPSAIGSATDAGELVASPARTCWGAGKRFFSDSADPRELALVSTKVTPTGVLMNTYRHVGSLRSKAEAARE